MRGELEREKASVFGIPRAIAVGLRGPELLAQPLLNKDGAFTEAERDAFQLRGLLPWAVSSIEDQVQVELEKARRKPDDLEKYIGLSALQDRNETLFYRLLLDHFEEFAPIVYTPTVGLACTLAHQIMRRPRGLWITPADQGRIAELLRHARRPGVRLIVATDNERILGLGDQGAGGMGIPVGKLSIYIAGAGIHPASTLPISLDVGTDNEDLLRDPRYRGYRQPRLRGSRYEVFLEAFVDAVKEVYPDALIQWEDFKQHNAIRVLDRYRSRLPSFNDDIQGTAAVALAGIEVALRSTGRPLTDQRIVLLGAGAAGIGIARLLHAAWVRAGASPEAARRAVLMLDSHGLIFEGRQPLDEDKLPYSLDPAGMARYGFEAAASHDLESVIEHFAPTALVGTSGVSGTFTEAAIRAMAARTETPIVLAMSNPTINTEAVPADVLAWTAGRALVATGSPFEPVRIGSRTWTIGQANNMFVFPGVGLGAIVSGAKEVTDGMFLVAAEALASIVSPERLAAGALYPPVGELRRASTAIAIAVAREAALGGVGRFWGEEEIEGAVLGSQWYPGYVPYFPEGGGS